MDQSSPDACAILKAGFIGQDYVPEISRFFGIAIRMYFDDHNPPHFHASYAEFEAQIGIDPVTILNGSLPGRAASMVFEWAALHQRELMQNWARLQSEAAPRQIAPLA